MYTMNNNIMEKKNGFETCNLHTGRQGRALGKAMDYGPKKIHVVAWK
jgi:hypothetical protein